MKSSKIAPVQNIPKKNPKKQKDYHGAIRDKLQSLMSQGGLKNAKNC